MFAQSNYPQQLSNGQGTIASNGSLVTAMCNLLEKHNNSIDPPSLDNLTINIATLYGGISTVDARFSVSTISEITGAWPSTNDAIVRFGTHYCAVSDIASHTIIDSSDGQLKQSPYGEPTGYVEYSVQDPLPVATPVQSAPLPAGAYKAGSQSYSDLLVDVPGYMYVGDAIDKKNPVTILKAGSDYYLFTHKLGCDNVTLVSGQRGYWINPEDNVLPPEPVVEPEEALVRTEWYQPGVVVEKVPDWKDTYKPFRDDYGETKVRVYVARVPVPFINIETSKLAGTMPATDAIEIGGTFEKDNKIYLRPKKAVDEYKWYGAIEVDEVTGNPNLELYSVIYNSEVSLEEKQVLGTLKFADFPALLLAWSRNFVVSFKKYMDIK